MVAGVKKMADNIVSCICMKQMEGKEEQDGGEERDRPSSPLPVAFLLHQGSAS